MPFLHVRSLYRDRPPDLPAVLEALCADAASATGIGLEHFSATWVDLRDGSYVAGGSATASDGSHPVLVDVLLPDLHGPERVEQLLHAVAGSLHEHAGIPLTRVFADVQVSRSGHVLERGEIVRWD